MILKPKPIIDYSNINSNIIEKYAEFINWGLVPNELFEEYKIKFNMLNAVKIRVIIENEFAPLKKKEFPHYPHLIYFFELNEFSNKYNRWAMQFNKSSKTVSFGDKIYDKIKFCYEDQSQETLCSCFEKLLGVKEVKYARLGYNSIEGTEKYLQYTPEEYEEIKKQKSEYKL